MLPFALEYVIFKQAVLFSIPHIVSLEALARAGMNTQVFCPDEIFGRSLLVFSASFS